MTYTARTYARSGKEPHICPDSFPSHPHILIQHPSKPEGVYVCPLALDHELSDAYRAAREAQEAAERAGANRKRAKEIADRIARVYIHKHDRLIAATAAHEAALEALESKES